MSLLDSRSFRYAIGRVVLGASLLSSTAFADAPLLSARARADEGHLSALIALRSYGIGFVRVDDPPPSTDPSAADSQPARPRSVSAELVLAPLDGVIELRGARSFQLTRPSAFQSAFQLGVSTYTVAKGPADFGAGPHVGLFAGLGGNAASVWLGAQGGVEAFLRTGGPRFPVRGVLGASFELGDLVLSLNARGGVDFEYGYHATLRGDAILTIGWNASPYL